MSTNNGLFLTPESVVRVRNSSSTPSFQGNQTGVEHEHDQASGCIAVQTKPQAASQGKSAAAVMPHAEADETMEGQLFGAPKVSVQGMTEELLREDRLKEMCPTSRAAVAGTGLIIGGSASGTSPDLVCTLTQVIYPLSLPLAD